MNIREFFYLQKSDRKVIAFLLCLGIGVLGAIFLLGNKTSRTLLNTADSTAFAAEKGSQMGSRAADLRHYEPENSREAELFPFDPNTADSAQLRRLGLAPYQIRNIYKYRAKGGVFRSPQAFAKVYGLTRKQYRDLEPTLPLATTISPLSRWKPFEVTSAKGQQSSANCTKPTRLISRTMRTNPTRNTTETPFAIPLK